jgi:hypothetical protein
MSDAPGRSPYPWLSVYRLGIADAFVQVRGAKKWITSLRSWSRSACSFIYCMPYSFRSGSEELRMDVRSLFSAAADAIIVAATDRLGEAAPYE